MATILSTIKSALTLKRTNENQQFYTQALKPSQGLSTFQLTMLGIGNMVGCGIWMFTGPDVRCVVGSANFLVYACSAIVTLLSAVCYAEFFSLIPKTGGAYTSSYICIGELCALLVGFDTAFTHVVSAALVAITLSEFLTELVYGTLDCNIDTQLPSQCGMASVSAACWKGSPNISSIGGAVLSICPEQTLERYLDETCIYGANASTTNVVPSTFHENYVALVVVVLVTIVAILELQYSTHVNTFLVSINLTTIFVVCATVVIYAARPSKSAYNNFCLNREYLPSNNQGIGTLAVMSTYFFAYMGYDVIAIAAEETTNHKKRLPLAMLIAVAVAALCYCGLSVVLSLLVPYYAVSKTRKAPILCALKLLNQKYNWVQYVMMIGATAGMLTSLSGLVYRCSRLVYAMASDRLLFGVLSKISQRTKVPGVALGTFGTLMAIVAMLVPSKFLTEMSAVGGLISVSLVSASLILLRYKDNDVAVKLLPQELRDGIPEHHEYYSYKWPMTKKGIRDFCDNNRNIKWLLLCSTIFALIIGIILKHIDLDPTSGNFALAICFIILFTIAWFACLAGILMHKKNSLPPIFKIPLVPVIPLLSIAINAIVMMQIDSVQWAKFLLWFLLPLLLYVCYGFKHSLQRHPRRRPPDILAISQISETSTRPTTLDLIPKSSLGGIQNPAYVLSSSRSSSTPSSPSSVQRSLYYAIPLPEDAALSMEEILALYPSTFVLKMENIEWDILDSSKILGSDGNFGSVFKGTLNLNGTFQPVAIKRAHVLNKENNLSLLKEALLMQQLNHVNIRKVHGVVFDTQRPEGALMIIMEYVTMMFEKFLRDPENNPTVGDLLNYAHQIALGMQYCHGIRNPLVHRDLAARNILINVDSAVVKISDFGLARHGPMYSIKHTDVALPVWYTAPEIFFGELYSEKSDVWAMGVLLWEMFSRCSEYPLSDLCCNMAIGDYLQSIDYKTRWPLAKPDGCPAQVYSLMQYCWAKKPEDRPDFTKLIPMIQLVYKQLDFDQQSPGILNTVVKAPEAKTRRPRLHSCRHVHSFPQGLPQYEAPKHGVSSGYYAPSQKY